MIRVCDKCGKTALLEKSNVFVADGEVNVAGYPTHVAVWLCLSCMEKVTSERVSSWRLMRWAWVRWLEFGGCVIGFFVGVDIQKPEFQDALRRFATVKQT